MDKSKEQQALEFVKEQAALATYDTDLHNAFFGIGGKFGELYSTRAEREAFRDTPEYEEICKIREALPSAPQATY